MLAAGDTVFLEWSTPWKGLSATGRDESAHVVERATVNDCVKIQRAAMHNTRLALNMSERALLLDFIAVYWATVESKSQH